MMLISEFKAAFARTRMSPDGQAVHGALLVLVDGLDIGAAAVRAGCSRQAIAAAIRRLERATGRCPYCGGKSK